ncbi:MFS transporter [Cyanobium sp. ATX 6A2]|uniref:MFS transporter n=1 Tax=Cyanobium sp. ATX 6A2 TaxID=2823700 RepID=UPI0020CBB83E|nr:MFS transporter [Cyanobium sp. ATX 6A2]
MTTPGQTVGVSVFLDPIIDDLGLTRSLVSLLYMLGTLTGSLALPWIGRGIDRFGTRRAVVAIAVLFSLACGGMALVQGVVTLGLGFIAIRGLGQGALGLVSINAINLWFVQRRGLALSLSGIGFALGIGTFPLLIEWLIRQYGWRWAYALLGGLVAVTILPAGALVFRRQPELYGLQPDGRLGARTQQRPTEANVTLAQARRTSTFWLFALGNGVVAALGTGLLFHHYSIMATAGVDRTLAALVFLPYGLVAAGANLVSGLLLDRISPRFLLSVMVWMLCLALLLAVRVNSPQLLVLYGVLLGLMQGTNGILQAGVYSYYFGRAHLGSISGFAATLMVAATAVGPLLFSVGFERFGSYALVLTLASLLPFTMGLVALGLELRQR